MVVTLSLSSIMITLKDIRLTFEVVNPCSGALIIIPEAYLIIVADAADAVSVNFSGRCKFLQI